MSVKTTLLLSSLLGANGHLKSIHFFSGIEQLGHESQTSITFSGLFISLDVILPATI